MKIVFATTNQGKFEEVKEVLSHFSIELEQYTEGYPEDQEGTLEDIARDGAAYLAERLGKPVVVEDSGIFFRAYNNFPGPLSKPIYYSIGVKGILKLLEGEERRAYFKTVVGFARPGEEAQTFSAVLEGAIVEEPRGEIRKGMLFDDLFILEGETRTNAELSIEEKNKHSQRAQAFREFGEFITSNS